MQKNQYGFTEPRTPYSKQSKAAQSLSTFQHLSVHPILKGF